VLWIRGAIYGLQSHFIAHAALNLDTIAVDTSAEKSAQPTGCDGCQLLEVSHDGAIRLVRLLLDRSVESIPVQVLILGSFVAEQYIDLSKSGRRRPGDLRVCAWALVLEHALDSIALDTLDPVELRQRTLEDIDVAASRAYYEDGKP